MHGGWQALEEVSRRLPPHLLRSPPPTQGEYSGPERKSTNSVGSLVQTLLGDSKAGAVQQLGESQGAAGAAQGAKA